MTYRQIINKCVENNIEKEERSKKVIEISKRKQQAFEESYIGKTVEILGETKQGDYYYGHTSNYLPIYVKTNKNICDIPVNVTVKEYKDGILIAVPEEE